MNNSASIKQMIQRMMPRPPEIVMGQVVSDNPVTVQILNDDKLRLSADMLTIPERMSGLTTGGYVHVFVYNNGKKYYVLDKAVR